MKTSDFDYHLPAELIAQHPVEPRGASRLLVLDRASGRIEHSVFRRLGEYLKAGDLMALNDYALHWPASAELIAMPAPGLFS